MLVFLVVTFCRLISSEKTVWKCSVIFYLLILIEVLTVLATTVDLSQAMTEVRIAWVAMFQFVMTEVRIV